MRRLAWQSRSVLRQQRCLGTAANIVEAVQPAVPIEIVAAISQRTHNVVQLPDEVEQVLGKHLGRGSKKGLRADSQALLQELRSRSRSTSRGGLNELQLTQAFKVDDQPQQKKVRRKRQARWQDKVQLLTLPGHIRGLAETVNIAEHGTAAAGINEEEEDMWAERTPPVQELAAPQYDSQQAAAYMAARMPACYAAVYKVLEEVSARLPAFAPESMLDFGAGPGTAVWAAQEVYGGQPGRVLAVEPSREMASLGQRIQAARSQVPSKSSGSSASAELGGDVHWVSSLPGTRSTRSKRSQAPRPPRATQQYDLVTAAYVLSELAGDAERRQVVQELWVRTKGILVLVEPGTPSGYQYILNAREQVLQAGLDEETGMRESSVVAPCPHDGACPMQGTPSWCHFVQRFERSSLQRITKVRQDGGLARTYQDERFSYVVLRRGGRKVGASQAISRHSSDAADMHDPQPYLDAQPRSWKKSEARYQRALALENLMEEMGQFEHPEGDSEVLEEATEYLIQQAIRLGADEEEELDLPIAKEQTQTSTAATAAGEPDGRGCSGDDTAPDRETAAAGYAEFGAEHAMSEVLPGRRDTAAAGACAREGGPGPTDAACTSGSLQAEESEQFESYGSEELEAGMAPELTEEQVTQMALAAARQSSTWGRIIRPPRKKGRHVILDLCTPLSALPQHRQAELSASRQAARTTATPLDARGEKDVAEPDISAEEGILVRQVLAAADKKTWLGPAGYALARDSKWGDLWPSYYINRAIITKIKKNSQ